VELVVEFEDRWMFNDWWITLDAPGFIQCARPLAASYYFG
jgi:hypothetical protein